MIFIVLPGSVKVSTGVMQVEKLSDADRQTAKLKINANNNRVALEDTRILQLRRYESGKRHGVSFAPAGVS